MLLTFAVGALLLGPLVFIAGAAAMGTARWPTIRDMAHMGVQSALGGGILALIIRFFWTSYLSG